MPAKAQYFPDEYVNGNIPKEITNAKDAVFYNISFLKDGAAVQPGASATVSIPVPTEFAKEYGNFLKVYRVEPDGKLTDMHAASHNGYLTFDTTHFSYYMVTRENIETGVPILLIVAAAGLAAAGIGVLIFIKKGVRKKRRKL